MEIGILVRVGVGCFAKTTGNEFDYLSPLWGFHFYSNIEMNMYSKAWLLFPLTDLGLN